MKQCTVLLKDREPITITCTDVDMNADANYVHLRNGDKLIAFLAKAVFLGYVDTESNLGIRFFGGELGSQAIKAPHTK